MDWSLDRSISWTAEFVDSDGSIISDHLPITGGSLDGNLDGQSLWVGRLTAEGSWPTSPAEMSRGFIRLGMLVNDVPYPLGWFHITADPHQVRRGWHSWSLEVIDPSIILARDLIITDLVVPRGTNVAQWARARIAAIAPGVPVMIADSSETTRTELFFDTGTSELELINTVLKSAAHTPIRAQPTGALSSEPWTDPADIGSAWTFESGAASILGDGFSLDTDRLAIPNRVVVEARGADGADPLRGIWEDHDPASPHSYEARRSWVTVIIRDADATSAAAATRIAEQEGRERQIAAVSLEVEHAWVPINLGDVVTLDTGDATIDGRWRVHNLDIPLDTSLVRASWRRV